MSGRTPGSILIQLIRLSFMNRFPALCIVQENVGLVVLAELDFLPVGARHPDHLVVVRQFDLVRTRLRLPGHIAFADARQQVRVVVVPAHRRDLLITDQRLIAGIEAIVVVPKKQLLQM